MKKKEPTTYTELLPVVVLYEGDIDGLISILRTSEESTVSFEHGDTVYETLAELREYQGEVLRDLTLRIETHNDADGFTHPTDVSFSKYFLSHRVSLSVDSAHELQFRRAIEYLKARRRRILGNDFLWIFVQTCLFVLPVFGYLHIRIYFDPSPQRFIILLGIGVLWAASVLFFTQVNFRRNLIVLKKRHEHASFFRRNESQIVRAGFGLAGGILGYVIRLLQE